MKSAEPSTTSDPTGLAEAFLEQLGNRYEVISKLGSGALARSTEPRTRCSRGTWPSNGYVSTSSKTSNETRYASGRFVRLSSRLRSIIRRSLRFTMSWIAPMRSSSSWNMSPAKRSGRRSTKEVGFLWSKRSRFYLRQRKRSISPTNRRSLVESVKPGNIMVRGDGGVKVMDFGIAKSEASGNLTAVGAILGTPNYMSPEQAEGLATVDRRSDLFSLGSIAFECLSGQKAFRAESVVGTLLRVVKGDTPQIDCDAVRLHPDAGKVVARALAKDPAKRFVSGAVFIEMLRKVPMIEGEPVPVPIPLPPSR